LICTGIGSISKLSSDVGR
jgi:hypothetical protein